MGRPTFKKNPIILLFTISILLAIIPSMVILFMPLVKIEGDISQRVGAYALAAIFWISLILELWLVRMCSIERKWLEKYRMRDRRMMVAKAGILSFAKTREGIIADIIMFISLIVVVAIVWLRVTYPWLILIPVSVLFLSFNMHCLLNGKNYRYIKKYISDKKGAEMR